MSLFFLSRAQQHLLQRRNGIKNSFYEARAVIVVAVGVASVVIGLGVVAASIVVHVVSFILVLLH